MRLIIVTFILIAGMLIEARSFQVVRHRQSIRPDLYTIGGHDNWRIVNRSASIRAESASVVVRFDERPVEGVAWFKDFSFDNGTIECDIHGQNVFQKSFVGIVFHGQDDTTYDAVYFRPFNFVTEDSARRSHAVQYISHPKYTWSGLRKAFPGKYEQPVSPVPNPDNWFHAQIVIRDHTVRVFLNNTKAPCLVVNQLSSRMNGWIGFFLGSGAGGEFRNLEVFPSLDVHNKE